MKGHKASHQEDTRCKCQRACTHLFYWKLRKLKHYVRMSSGKRQYGLWNYIVKTNRGRRRQPLRCFKSMKTNRKNTDWNKDNSLLATLRELLAIQIWDNSHSPVLTRDHSHLDCFCIIETKNCSSHSSICHSKARILDEYFNLLSRRVETPLKDLVIFQVLPCLALNE